MGVTNSRECKNWGGVAIYLRPDLTFIRRTDIDIFEEGVFESVFVEIVDRGKSFFVGVIYRPPDSNMAQFTNKLNLVLDKLKDKRCYLMGDFNLDLIKSDHHEATANFVSDMSSAGLHPLISLPTRITSHSATLIEYIFTNDICTNISSGVLFSSISDHLPAFAFFGDSGVIPTGPCFTLKRKIGVEGKEEFRNWVKNWGKNFAPKAGSVAEDSVKFENELGDVYNLCFPLKKIRIRKIDEKKPWLTDVSFL